MAFVYSGKVPGNTRAERARNIRRTMRMTQSAGISKARAKFKGGSVRISSPQLNKSVKIDIVPKQKTTRVSIAGTKSPEVRQAIAQRLLERGQIVKRGALKLRQQKAQKQRRKLITQSEGSGLFEIKDPSTGLTTVATGKQVRQIQQLQAKQQDVEENRRFKQKLEEGRPLSYKVAKYLNEGARGWVEGYKKTKTDFTEAKGVSNKAKIIAKETTGYVSSVMRGLSKTLQGVVTGVQSTQKVNKNLYIIKKKAEKAQQLIKEGKKIPKKISIKKELKNLQKEGIKIKKTLQTSNDQDVKNARALVSLVGLGFVATPTLGAIATYGGVAGKLVVGGVELAGTTAYLASIGKEAKKKGLISAVTKGAIDLGALVVGGQLSKSVFSNYYKNLEITQQKKKIIKEIKKIKDIPQRTKQKLIQLAKKGTLAHSKLVKLYNKQIKVMSKIQKLQKQLAKAKTASTKKNIKQRIEKLRLQHSTLQDKINLQTLTKTKKLAKPITKSKAKKELTNINKKIKSLYKRYQNKNLLRTTRKKIRNDILKLELQKRAMQSVIKTGKRPSGRKWRKSQRKEILKKLRREEQKLAKILKKEKELKDLAIRRVRKQKGKMPKSIKKQPIQAGRYKGKYALEIQTESGKPYTMYYSSYKQWRKALVRQQKQFIKKQKTIKDLIKTLSSKIKTSKTPSTRDKAIARATQIKTNDAKVDKWQDAVRRTNKLLTQTQKGGAGVTTKTGRQQLIQLQKQKSKLKKILGSIKKTTPKYTTKARTLKVKATKGLIPFSMALSAVRSASILGLLRVTIPKVIQSINNIQSIGVQPISTTTSATAQTSIVTSASSSLLKSSLSLTPAVISTLALTGISRVSRPIFTRQTRPESLVTSAYNYYRKKKGKYFIYLPDLQSILFGFKASPKEARRLTAVGRVFTGLEVRKIIP